MRGDPVQPERPARVVIAGGGVAALEAALALGDLTGDRVAAKLCSPRGEFVYRPFAVGEPFGAARAHSYDWSRLAPRCGASFQLGGVVSVDTEAQNAITCEGERIPYDYLIVAPGVRMLWAVPGAVTFWGAADEGGVGAVIRKLRAGALRNIVFTMPSGSSWVLPLYELALRAASVRARSGIEDGRLVVVTPEDAPLSIVGSPVSEQIARLMGENGIEVVTATDPVEFDGNRLRIEPGEPIETEAVISLPGLEGPCIDGLPQDRDGFVAVDEHCRVDATDHVFAAGDVTAFPVKQGGIATQQADAAAEAIAADTGCVATAPAPFEPILRGALWTGADPHYLYGRTSGGRRAVSTLTDRTPWSEPPGKIVSRYLSPFLSGMSGDGGIPVSARVASRG